MATEKILNTRVQLKIDTSANWAKATNFIPKKGEPILYSDTGKFKIGDGVTAVNALPFFNEQSQIQLIRWEAND